MSCHVAGIDISSHAIDIVLLDETTDHAAWHRYNLAGQTAFDRCRQVRQQMPTASWWDNNGVYLAAIERPYGPSRIAQAALYRTLGAVIACIPSRLPLWEVSPQEWRAGIGVAARASKDEVREAVVKIMCPTVDMLARGIGGGPRTYEWRDWPQDAHDAFAVAYTARAKNTAAITQSAA